MSGAPERKYTDRDVREDDSLRPIVESYLDTYEGEFDYLVDMKMTWASGRDLTTPQVRGVLNCMRHDPRLNIELPEPLQPSQGEVVSLVYRRKEKKNRSYPCPLKEQGFFHHHKVQSGWSSTGPY